MDHAVAEPSLVQQLEPHTNIVLQGWIASSHNDGGEEQMTLVDQPELDRLGSQRGTAYGEVASRSRLSCWIAWESNSRSIDVRALDTEALGVDDLVGGLPDPRVLLVR